MKSLLEIYADKNTDKLVDHSYVPLYETLFEALREQPIRLLEIGVLHGGSLLAWLEFFPAARILGLDLSPPSNLRHERLTLIAGNQTDETLLRSLGELDIVIDDGSHIPGEQALSYRILRDHTSYCYCVEDIQPGENALGYWRAIPNATVHEFYKNQRQDDVLVVVMHNKKINVAAAKDGHDFGQPRGSGSDSLAGASGQEIRLLTRRLRRLPRAAPVEE